MGVETQEGVTWARVMPLFPTPAHTDQEHPKTFQPAARACHLTTSLQIYERPLCTTATTGVPEGQMHLSNRQQPATHVPLALSIQEGQKPSSSYPVGSERCPDV